MDYGDGWHELSAPPRRRRGAARVARRCCAFVGGLIVLFVLALGLLVGLLAHGPIAIDGLGPRIAAVLQDRFGRGAVFTLGTTSLVKRGFGPSFSIEGLAVNGPDGEKVLSAPRAEVSIDPLPLLYGKGRSEAPRSHGRRAAAGSAEERQSGGRCRQRLQTIL